MKNTRSPSLLSCPPSSFPWLHPHPASSATFSRGHTHRDTHRHAQMHTFKHQTCSSYKAGLYSLGRVYALYVFAPVCVYIGVCMCAWTLVFPLSSGLPTTNIAPSLFPSFSLPLFCCTNPPPPAPATMDHERQAQPFLQIPTLTSQKCYIHICGCKFA